MVILKAGTGTVTSSPAGIDCGGTCDADFTENTDVTLTATPAAGSTFAGWSGGTGSASGCTGTSDCTFNITDNSGVTATFTLNQYSITTSVNPSAGGSVSCSPNPVNHGSTSSCTVTTNTGYSISTVTGCGGAWTGSNPYITSAITANCTVAATFTLNQYTVTPSAGANGNISPNSPQTLNHGATTTFTVTSNAGYTASVGGTCGGNLSGNTYTTNAITANCTVVATFTPASEPPPPPPPIPSDIIYYYYDPAIQYTGGWMVTTPYPCGYQVMAGHNIGGTGTSMSLNFTGTSIRWHTMTSPQGGWARVYIDGQLAGRVSLYSDITQCDVEVFRYNLSSGNHTIRIVPEQSLPGIMINIYRFVAGLS